MSDVCDEVLKDEEHKNQCGLLGSEMISRLSSSSGDESHSRLSTRAKSSSTVSERSGKGQDTVEKVALEKAKTAA